MYEIIEDYQAELDTNIKSEIFDEFVSVLWKTKIARQKYDKHISYKVEDIEDNIVSDIFKKYESITYTAYKSTTDKKDSWSLLKQKINNIYTNMCDTDICFKKDYMLLLNTPKKLYYRFKNNELGIGIDELDIYIQNSLSQANLLKDKYKNQNIKINWNKYKELINGYLLRIFNNYIPLEDFEDKSTFTINLNFWNEDNYVVKYFCKSLSGYIKNYQKEYFDVARNKEYKQCQCGGILERVPNGKGKKGYHLKCNQCRNPAYQPLEEKTIKCQKCHKMFTVEGIVKNVKRCPECQEEHIRQLKTQKQREYRK